MTPWRDHNGERGPIPWRAFPDGRTHYADWRIWRRVREALDRLRARHDFPLAP